jgi:hypothetical protein
MLNFYLPLFFLLFYLQQIKKILYLCPVLKMRAYNKRKKRKKNETQNIIHTGDKKDKGIKYFYTF